MPDNDFREAAVMPAASEQAGMLQSRYAAKLAAGELSPDSHQLHVVELLDTLCLELVERSRTIAERRSRIKWLPFVKAGSATPLQPLKGLYLWGGVGRGKTYLLDLFYETLPFEKKVRLHFHRFMQIVHDDLKALGDLEDPLEPVAQKMAGKALVLCLDELQVNDIADAMLLARLFEHLFQQGVTIVTTSNFPPRDLYRNGLQRARFLPAIDLLEEHTQVVAFGGETDYRLRLMKQLDVYLISDGELSEQRLRQHFLALRGINLHQDRTDIIINHRRIPVKMWADGIVWFSFDVLCNTPRGTNDYIEIATFFHTVMISDIPAMGPMQDDAARRFINMVDEFYDRNVNLIVSAEVMPRDLYYGSRLAEVFTRTSSRLIEMQSKDYFAREHREVVQ